MAYTYKELLEMDEDISFKRLKFQNQKYVVVHDGQCAWVAHEEDFERAIRQVADSDDPERWYGDFCALCPAVPVEGALRKFLEHEGIEGNWSV